MTTFSPDEVESLKRGWFGRWPSSLQALILAHSRVRSYRRGEFIVREGEPGKGLFALLRGRTRHVRSVGDGEEVLLHVGEAGLWFGEYPMLCGSLTIGSVIADAPVRVLFLPAKEFQTIVDDEPRYYRCFCELLCERFALLFRYAAEVHGLAPDEWLHSRLAGILELQQSAKPSADPKAVTLSQRELANMVGVSRQTLNSLLASLKARGIIEIGYRMIRVLR